MDYDRLIDSRCRVVYQHLVGAYARNGNIDKINDILATMQLSNIRISDPTHNFCVRCHLERG